MTNPTPRGDAADSLRPEAPPASDRLEPGDLLSDDPEQSVDLKRIRTRSQAAVSPSECARLRDALRTNERAVPEVKAALGYPDLARETLADHYRGRCSHDHNTPPVRYDHETKSWHTVTDTEADR